MGQILLLSAGFLVLVAISDIDRPYQGALTVQPEGFSFTRDMIGAQQ